MGNLPLRTSPTQKTMEPNDRVTTFGTTSGTIPNYGKTLLSSTVAAAHTMANPIPGVRKVIVQTGGTSTIAHTITGLTTTVLFVGASTVTPSATTLTFTALNASIELEGRTSLIWDIVATNGATLS